MIRTPFSPQSQRVLPLFSPKTPFFKILFLLSLLLTLIFIFLLLLILLFFFLFFLCSLLLLLLLLLVLLVLLVLVLLRLPFRHLLFWLPCLSFYFLFWTSKTKVGSDNGPHWFLLLLCQWGPLSDPTLGGLWQTKRQPAKTEPPKNALKKGVLCLSSLWGLLQPFSGPLI